MRQQIRLRNVGLVDFVISLQIALGSHFLAAEFIVFKPVQDLFRQFRGLHLKENVTEMRKENLIYNWPIRF